MLTRISFQKNYKETIDNDEKDKVIILKLHNDQVLPRFIINKLNLRKAKRKDLSDKMFKKNKK